MEINPNYILLLFIIISILSALIVYEKLYFKEESQKIIELIKNNPSSLENLIKYEPEIIEKLIMNNKYFLSKIIYENQNLLEYILENNFSHLESVILIKNEKDPNLRIKFLKDLSNLLENIYNYKENSDIRKKTILKELGNLNNEIGKIYIDNRNKLKDRKGKLFDSYNSKLILAEYYFSKSFELYDKINDCYYLKISKNDFCEVYIELHKIKDIKDDVYLENERQINIENLFNSSINKCFNICFAS